MKKSCKFSDETNKITKELESRIINAYEKENFSEFEDMYDSNINRKTVNADRLKKRLLKIAISKGHLETVKFLIKQGVNLELEISGGYNPLYYAASNGHIEIVECLIEHNVNINAKSSISNHSALHIAVYKSHIDIVNLLINKGADVNIKDHQQKTPLHLAAFSGHLNIVKILLHKGAKISDKLLSGKSALHIAAQQGHSEIVDCLLEQNANIHTALHLGTIHKKLRIFCIRGL